MSCDCENIKCICVAVSPYDTGIDTGLIAPVAGDYLFLIEFNGTYQRLVLTLTLNELIILPTLNTQAQFMVNGNYDHLMKIYKPDGDLLGDTCYSLNVRTVTTSGNGLVPSNNAITKACSITVYIKDVPNPTLKYTLCNGQQINLEYPSGNTLTIPHLAGKYVNRPFYLDGAVEMEPNYNSITGTWDNTGNGGFVDGNKIIIQYDEPI